MVWRHVAGGPLSSARPRGRDEGPPVELSRVMRAVGLGQHVDGVLGDAHHAHVQAGDVPADVSHAQAGVGVEEHHGRLRVVRRQDRTHRAADRLRSLIADSLTDRPEVSACQPVSTIYGHHARPHGGPRDRAGANLGANAAADRARWRRRTDAIPPRRRSADAASSPALFARWRSPVRFRQGPLPESPSPGHFTPGPLAVSLPEDVPVTCRGPAARSPGSGSRRKQPPGAGMSSAGGQTSPKTTR